MISNIYSMLVRMIRHMVPHCTATEVGEIMMENASALSSIVPLLRTMSSIREKKKEKRKLESIFRCYHVLNSVVLKIRI